MTTQQFVWWLNGFIECVEMEKLPMSKEWRKIQETLQIVTCWEIEQGTDK